MPPKGGHMTPEHRAKIAASNLGLKKPPWSAATRAKLMPTRIGRHPSPETRAKLSAAKRGNRNHDVASVKGDCVYCGRPATTHDHAIPRGRPGWDAPDNVVLACLSCNTSKHERTPEEWLAAGLYGNYRVRS